LPHTHVALDDAIEQGALFCNMLAELRASGPIAGKTDASSDSASQTNPEGKTAQS
jgi:hypothetical protein